MIRRSKQFELTGANLQLLSLMSIDITVYQGTVPGDVKRDIVVGTLSVSMLNALKDGSVNAKMALKLQGEESNPYEVGIRMF